MAQVLHDGTIRHEDNCLSDLGHTTQASVASRLTDNEILNLAERHTRIDSRSLPQFVVDNCRKSAAVLRDYVRLREENAQLAARLESVVNMLSNVYHDCRYSNAVSMFKDEYDAILRAACGETSRNGNNSGNSSENRNVKGSENGK